MSLVAFGAMDAIPLDPGDYPGTYKLVGGQASLDLVNTVSWPGRPREHDWFDPVQNVPAWAAAAGILDPRAGRQLTEWVTADPTRSVRELAAARRVRSALAAVLGPYVRGEMPAPSSLDALNRLLVRASARRRLSATPTGPTMTWTFADPRSFEEMLAPAIVNAAEVLTTLDRDRLGSCPGCDWLFHDTTRNGRRVWCDMADCGGRAKARRHYHRQHP